MNINRTIEDTLRIVNNQSSNSSSVKIVFLNELKVILMMSHKFIQLVNDKQQLFSLGD